MTAADSTRISNLKRRAKKMLKGLQAGERSATHAFQQDRIAEMLGCPVNDLDCITSKAKHKHALEIVAIAEGFEGWRDLKGFENQNRPLLPWFAQRMMEECMNATSDLRSILSSIEECPENLISDRLKESCLSVQNSIDLVASNIPNMDSAIHQSCSELSDASTELFRSIVISPKGVSDSVLFTYRAEDIVKYAELLVLLAERKVAYEIHDASEFCYQHDGAKRLGQLSELESSISKAQKMAVDIQTGIIVSPPHDKLSEFCAHGYMEKACMALDHLARVTQKRLSGDLPAWLVSRSAITILQALTWIKDDAEKNTGTQVDLTSLDKLNWQIQSIKMLEWKITTEALVAP
ncbi:hypothetical protein SYK_31090 [Pseudodesulfovibrio nedwellii]|uniref:Uncharacterized protein n=1 Tax=Pseudodesulfovibrio nedwellii TaxID=2973072 RepID=A0ABN6S637_9BACT|nr:hypothetical protein [Pseudodesulfovibrio nedwellii]BDQ38749.1 hypothetical protein SYK_31090 [Pseudodesulfovibrio nedwellii]